MRLTAVDATRDGMSVTQASKSPARLTWLSRIDDHRAAIPVRRNQVTDIEYDCGLPNVTRVHKVTTVQHHSYEELDFS